MTRKWIPVLIIIATLVLSACQAAMATPQAPMEVSSAPSTGITDSYDKSVAESAGAFGDVSSTETTDRLVIKNANLSMAVIDPASAMNSVAQLATDMGGFVVSSNLYKTTDSNGVETPQANISIRVPAEKLDDAMTKIKTLAPDPKNDILSENVSGQDVTKEYTDLNSRLVNLQAAEKQLQAILDETTKTEDVLAVYNQLISVREQIEVIKGQMTYFEESAALSMVSVSFVTVESVQPLSIGGWEPVGVARDALQATLNGMKVLANIAIWMILFILPIGLLIVLPIWLVIRLLARLTKKKPAPVTPEEPTPPAQPKP